MSAASMRLRMTGARIVAWGLRNFPKATNSLAEKTAKYAAPIVRKITGRDYRLGQTRFKAKIYNYERHITSEQKAEQEEAVNEAVKSFWGGLKEHLPTRGEAVLTMRPILTDAAPPNLSARKDRIDHYVSSKLFTLAKTPYGLEIVYGVRKNTPKEVYLSLTSSNLYTWFFNVLKIETRHASLMAKRPWEFWNPEMVRGLPLNFRNACWGIYK